MAKQFYLPKSDEGKMTWLNNLAVKLPNHAATLGISTETVTSVQNDANMFSYMINLVNSFKNGMSERVGYKDIIKNAPEGTSIGPVPVFNNTPPPTVVPAGIFIRVRRLVQNIKSNNNYNESIGGDLGIIGAETDEATLDMKPTLKIKMTAGKPEIIWKKGTADSLDIYVDRGDGKSFIYLANDSAPNYTDNATLPDGMNMNEWKYKAIYRIKDEQVGQFSDVISVMVKKEIA
jgi:hypothetical protein